MVIANRGCWVFEWGVQNHSWLWSNQMTKIYNKPSKRFKCNFWMLWVPLWYLCTLNIQPNPSLESIKVLSSCQQLPKVFGCMFAKNDHKCTPASCTLETKKIELEECHYCKFFTTSTKTSQNSSKWCQFSTDHNECIRPL